MEFLSTSALANEIGINSTELFAKLKSLGWIDRKNDKWVLTDLGIEKGGKIQTKGNYGEYIIWPGNISITNGSQNEKRKLINATHIGANFSITAQRLNLILSELGWIEKDIAGWKLTKLGFNLGGRKFEHETSGGTYVLWPENILTNKNLVSVFKEVKSVEQDQKLIDITSDIKNFSDDFRAKFPATLRTKDGHMVRSRAELLIDNALYDYRLAHAYERKLPIEEDLYSDFFLPSENVYIEYWGMENDPRYKERMQEKLNVYKKYEFKLIELTDSDIASLDDHLPKKLLKFNIKVY